MKTIFKAVLLLFAGVVCGVLSIVSFKIGFSGGFSDASGRVALMRFIWPISSLFILLKNDTLGAFY